MSIDLTKQGIRVLIIDDEPFKAKDIEEALKRILNKPVIDTRTARNPGLIAIIEADKSGNKYDLVISDNYMPLYDNSYELEPYGTDIMLEIERRGIDCIKLICSSGTVADVDADYKVVRYNSSVSMDNVFKNALGLS